MKDFGLLLMFSSDFRAPLLKWHLFPFILQHFGARVSYARCSLHENALRRAFLEDPAVVGWGALQCHWVRCSAQGMHLGALQRAFQLWARAWVWGALAAARLDVGRAQARPWMWARARARARVPF
ncbi:hypothetical protein L484_006421 [Morus notabilis]|uniref:Uncharacterized protein n=1 Tax=Morus notabilis TaxID=981085 RepID=W9RQ83_9ROSA|nr:hypothetical protein L484_006421 [Morus notabilis]